MPRCHVAERDPRRQTTRRFAFESDVDQRTYLVHGIGLLGVRYAIDAVLIGLCTDLFWAPWGYLNPVRVLGHISNVAEGA